MLFRQLEIGPFGGWLAYTYGVSRRQRDTLSYWPGHDRRHNLNVVGTWKPNARYTMSARLGLAKDFTLPGSFSMLLRLDVLNVFNTRNYAQYTDGYPDRPYYFVDGNISGVPRTLKLTMNMKL